MGHGHARLDVLVIGAGSAGVAAAERARAGGAKRVAIVERDKVGGECPHYACVPTKALLGSAHLFELGERATEFGLRAEMGATWAEVAASKDRAVAAVAEGKEQMIRDAGIELIRGEACFLSRHDVRVGDRVLRAVRIVIAAGSVPSVPRVEGLREAGFVTSRDAIALERLPRSLVIVGGGAVGVEFAQIFSAFGVRVTLAHKGARLLAKEDAAIGEALGEAFARDGVELLLGAQLRRVERAGGEKQLWFEVEGRPRALTAQEILVAIGRRGAVDDLALDAAGVEANERGVVAGDDLRTSVAHIWAAGDVIAGNPQFTHVAAYQGALAGHNAVAARSERQDLRVIPRITFSEPPVASVGLTEEHAREEVGAVVAGVAPIAALGKAVVERSGQGFVKLVADARSRRILGGHIYGPVAGELVHEVAAAMKGALTADDLASMVHAYPSYSEAIALAAGEAAARAREAAEEIEARVS